MAALFPLTGFENDRLWRAAVAAMAGVVVAVVAPVVLDGDEDWLF